MDNIVESFLIYNYINIWNGKNNDSVGIIGKFNEKEKEKNMRFEKVFIKKIILNY